MKTVKIQLAFPKTDYGKQKVKTDQYIYAINIEGIIKYFQSENGADRYLSRLGFVYNIDTGFYEKTKVSEQEVEFDNHFEVYVPKK